MSSDFLKAVLEVANDLLQTLDKIVEKIGPGGVLTILTSIVALTKTKSIKSAFDWVSDLGDIFKNLSNGKKVLEATTGAVVKGSKAGTQLATSMGTLAVSTESASGAFAGLIPLLTNPAFLGIAAVVIGGAIAWDTFTVSVKEAEQAVKESEDRIVEIQSEIDQLNALELKDEGQKQRLDYLNDALELEKQILEVAKETAAIESYGHKVSDVFDSNNAYNQYQNDMAGRGFWDAEQEKVVDTNKQSAEGNIYWLKEYRKQVEETNEALKNQNITQKERNKLSAEGKKADQSVQRVEKALREDETHYLNELLDYNQKISDARDAISKGYLKQGTDEYDNAVEMIAAYSKWIAQDEAVLAQIQQALGKYDYFQDGMKKLASDVAQGNPEDTYRMMMEYTEGYSDKERNAWLKAAQGANSYSQAIRLGDEAVKRLRGDIDALSSSTEHSIAIAWNLADALAKYNISQDSFDKYLAVFKELNPELAENEQLLQQAAVANMAFDQSVEDLRSHLNDYVENLKTLDESSVAYAESLQSLAQDLSGLTGIDFSITDAQNFASDINNLELLRQALDGDNDALNRLRENANQMIIVRLRADAELVTDDFDAQYNELVNWIADNPNIGTLEAQSYLNASPFIQTCMELIKQGKMTTQDLQKIFANLGWNITWDETKMKVPSLKKSGHKSTIYKGDKYGGSTTVDWGWDELPVPTNIRFVGKSSGVTAPKVSKPTSSSGSNYKPEQKKSGGGGGKSASDKAKDDEKKLEDTYDEFFDYFERRVKVLTDAISLLDAHLENVVGSAAKNKLLDAQERIYKMQQQEYAGAKEMYQQMADQALDKVPEQLRDKIKNGAVAIDEFINKGKAEGFDLENEEIVEALNNYTKWADKVSECTQKLAELREELRQLELKRFKNIAQDWQDLFDLRQNNAIDLIDKQIDLFEEAGQLIGKSFYEEQKAQAQKQYELLSNERKALVDELNRGLSNGTIEIGSDEWLEMRSILSDLEGQILDCAKAIETFDNAILQLHVDVFERIQGQLDDFDDQLSDMASFLDDADVGNKYGEWSQEGMARAGLLAQQFDLANKKVHDYAEEIEWLNEQYKLGKYSTTEYMDRLADLMSEQRDAAQTADDMKDAMVELNRDRVDIVIDGINEEIKAYEELIDAQKKALQAQKDLHDYEKQVADENKAIVDIERQLTAIRNDDSAAANAKRKQLEAQLKDAQDQLSETEYDHSITAQEDALDAQMEQYRQMREAEIQSWEEYAANIEQVMIDMLAMVQANAFEIGTVITETATAHGFQISQALTDPWFTAQQTIAQYGEVLSAETSSFIASLENVEQETWNLQAQADATSVQLAQMFGNRADNLVNELQRSWNSEENLRNATNALNEAFVAAIDTGGQIGQIIAPLESAKAATDALADAADSAASAFDGMADSARRAAQEAANANSMPTTASRGTPYEPPYKTHVTTLYNAPYSTVKWDRIGGYYRYYAKGLSKADKDQLAWTQELGDEVIVSPTRSSILTPIKKGDAVIDAKGTRNLFELAKVDPKQLLNGMSSASTPTLQQNKAFGVNISSLVTVNGPINDSLAMMKIAANEAQSKITKTLKDLSDEIKY